MSVDIRPVEGKKQVRQFIDFPHSLYKDDANYVPEIYLSQKDLLNTRKNPFFKHSEAQLFLAWQDGSIVGRIAGIANNNYNDYHKSNVGFFGFFDVVEDFHVANLLLDKAANWCKEKGFDAVLGPTNFTTNDTSGILVDGFDSPPVVMMTYNKPYYADFVEKYGFQNEMNLYAYWLPSFEVSSKSIAIASRVEQRLNSKGITIRKVNMKNFDKEVLDIRKVYNEAWERNWGFVPSTIDEFNHTAEGLKLLLNPELCYIAEHDGKVIGFGLALPDINEIMIKVKRGRLFPFGIFRLLWGKSRVKKVRVITLGVIPAYRKMGIAAIFYAKFIQMSRDKNLAGGEASWVLENNEMMRTGMENMGGKIYKTYRIYSKSI
jgi:GNAT superfamily N-acetyltransferase